MPLIIYYIVLYLIIIITNYFRLKAEEEDPNTPEYEFPWKRIFFISNEIIYTGSGVYIILLKFNSTWVAPIMAILILLIVISLYMIAMEKKFSDKIKFRTHTTIIIIIIAGTFITFSFLDDNEIKPEANKAIKQVDSTFLYKIAIPYTDNSIIKNYGYDKFGEKYLSYYVEVIAKSEKQARNSGISDFWCDTLLQPIINKDIKLKNDMNFKKALLKIDINHIVINKSPIVTEN